VILDNLNTLNEYDKASGYDEVKLMFAIAVQEDQTILENRAKESLRMSLQPFCSSSKADLRISFGTISRQCCGIKTGLPQL
jgi:hypothetical protein